MLFDKLLLQLLDAGNVSVVLLCSDCVSRCGILFVEVMLHTGHHNRCDEGQNGGKKSSHTGWIFSNSCNAGQNFSIGRRG